MKLLLTAGATAASMYFLDPARGPERRADARTRLEHGKEAVAQGVQTASSGFDTASRQTRLAGRRLSHDAGKMSEEAKNFAAAAAATVASILNRNQSRAKALSARSDRHAKSRLIPGGWMTIAGLGAAAVYYFGSSEGEARRASLRARLTGWRQEAQAKAKELGRKLPGKRDGQEELTGEDDLADSMTANGSGGRLGSQERLQDRPL